MRPSPVGQPDAGDRDGQALCLDTITALASKLREVRFSGVDMRNPKDGNLAYFSGRIDGLRLSNGSGYMVAARV